MRGILFINACPRPNSRTLELAQRVLMKMDGEIQEVCLFEECPAYLTWTNLQLRDRYVASKDFSHPMFHYAREFSEADEIVIAAPYWDLMFPAVLKNYLENVSVAGVTFRYSTNGIPTGLCRAKKLYYITTAGGYIGDNDFGFSYIKALAENLFGIKNVICIRAEGLDISDDCARESMQKAIRNITDAALEKNDCFRNAQKPQ